MRRLKHDSQCQATGYKVDVHSICWSFPTSAVASVSSFLAGDAHKNHLCPNSRLIFWIFCNKLGPSRLSLFCSSSLVFSITLYFIVLWEHLVLLLRLLFASRILFYWLPPLSLKKNQTFTILLQPESIPTFELFLCSYTATFWSCLTNILEGVLSLILTPLGDPSVTLTPKERTPCLLMTCLSASDGVMKTEMNSNWSMIKGIRGVNSLAHKFSPWKEEE